MAEEEIKYHIQILDWKRLFKYEDRFPVAVREIREHNETTTSSWYDLSEDAHSQYLDYTNLICTRRLPK